MSKKIFGIIIVFLGALLLVGLVYFLFLNNGNFDKLLSLFNKEKTAVPAQTETNNNIGPEANQPAAVKKIIIDNSVDTNTEPKIAQTESTKQIGKNELMRMAASFAERFGSYSNQSNFSNIIDLRMFMSRRMQKWADDYVAQQRLKGAANDIYYGITTKAIGEEVTAYDDHIGQASVAVNTRRREAVNSTGNTEKTFSQDVVINFILENGAWKVDAANWID